MSVACDRYRSIAIACQRSERRAYMLKSIGNILRSAAARRSPSETGVTAAGAATLSGEPVGISTRTCGGHPAGSGLDGCLAGAAVIL